MQETPNTQLLNRLENILLDKGITFEEMCDGISTTKNKRYAEEVRKILTSKTVATGQFVITVKLICDYLKIDQSLFLDNRHDILLDKVKERLKEKNMSFVELSTAIGVTNAGLYRAFHNQTVPVSTLIKIANVLGISVSYFFEEEVIERLSDSIMKFDKDPSLKSFMFSFSRDITKGMKVEDAVFKNLDPEKYNTSLIS